MRSICFSNGLRKSRFFGGVYPEPDEGPQNDILTQSLMGEDEGEGDQQITPHPRIWSGASSNLLLRGEGKNECPDTDEGKPTSTHPGTLFTYDGSYGIL
jgi:hypothetical protein